MSADRLPVAFTEEPIFSDKQFREVRQIAVTYLKGNSKRYRQGVPIDVSADSLSVAYRVLGDAAKRALVSSDKQVFGGKETLGPLISQGLAIRKGIANQASVYLNAGAEEYHPSLVGPYAIHRSIFQSARREVLHLDTEVIKEAEKVVQQGTVRSQLLVQFGTVALQNLPLELQGVALERFPMDQERAKLVRNSIASFVFRGNLSPNLTISDLREFSQRYFKNTQIFNTNLMLDLVKAVGVSGPEALLYLSDLFQQTEAAFAQNLNTPTTDDEVEVFFHRFSQALLLLHPALEEEVLIVTPSLYDPNHSNLWQEAVNFGTALVPNREMLIKALRQQIALGQHPAAGRLKDALKGWGRYHTDKAEQTKRVHAWEERIKIEEANLDDLDDPAIPLPRESYEIRFKHEAEARQGYLFSVREGNILIRLSEERAQEIKEGQEYQRWIEAFYGDNQVAKVPMPYSLKLKRLAAELRSLQHRGGGINQKVSLTADLLELDLILPNKVALIDALLDKDPDQVRSEVKKTIDQPSEDKLFVFNPADLTDDEIRDNFSQIRRRISRNGIPILVRDNLQFWALIIQDVLHLSNQSQRQAYLEEYYPEILEQRARVLQFGLDAVSEIFLNKIALDQAQERLTEYQQMPHTFLADEYWSMSEARSFIREINLSELPPLNLDLQAEESFIAKARRTLYGPTVNEQLRKQPSNRITYKKWVANFKAQAQQIFNEAQKRPRIPSFVLQDRFFELELAQTLEKLADHPLFPSIIDQLPAEMAIRICRRRVDIAYVQVMVDKIAGEQEDKLNNLEEILRQSYRRRLEDRIISLLRGLELLKARDVDGEFVDRMKQLGVVLTLNK